MAGRHRLGPRTVGRTAGAAARTTRGPRCASSTSTTSRCPTGEVGELVVRSAEPWALNVGYYKMPEQTAAAWRNGWFHTGDAFRRDDDGWYYFVDRLRDAIRRRGENISSFEVETLVAEHPDVRECAAIGVPAPLGEDDVMVAVIVRRPERVRSRRAARVPRAAHAAVHAARATWRWSTTSRAPRRRCGSASTSSATRASPPPPGTARRRADPGCGRGRPDANMCSCPNRRPHRRLDPPRRPRRLLRLGRAARRSRAPRASRCSSAAAW